MNLDADYFETIIAYKVLTDYRYAAGIADYLKPLYIKNQNVRTITNIVFEFLKRRSKLPTPTEIRAYLTTDQEKQALKSVLMLVKNINRNIDDAELYLNTEKYIREKAVYHTLVNVTDRLGEQELDPQEVYTQFEHACNINITSDTGVKLFGDSNRVIDLMGERASTIKTGWSWLDEQIGGGFLEKGRGIYIFLGITNIGKSIFLGNVAKNISKQGKNVLIVSLEMPEVMYAQRLYSTVTNIPLSELMLSPDTLKHAVSEVHEGSKYGEIFVKEFPPNTITPAQLESFIMTLERQETKIDAIVLDYVNLIRAVAGNNSYERIKDITERLRALTYKFNCPIISASQLNRSSVNNNNPDFDTVSESIGLAATADCLITLTQDEEDRELDIIRMNILKNRFGRRGIGTHLKVDYSTLTVLDEEVNLDDEKESNDVSNTLETLVGGSK